MCTNPLLRTMRNASNHETHKLLLEWIHEFKSLESSDSEQHKKEIKETKVWRTSQKKKQEKNTPEEEIGKYRNSSVTPVSQSHCLALVRRKSYSISSSFVENSSQCSWPSSVNTSRNSWMQVYCCFQMRHFVGACEAVLRNYCFPIVVISFSLWLCDVGCFFVTRSHSTKVTRWSTLVILSCFLLLSFLHSHCVNVSCRAHLLLSLAMLIQILLVWLLISIGFSCASNTCLQNSLISVFQSLCWSYSLSSILGSIQQPVSAIFHSVMLRFAMPLSISCLWGLFPHRIFTHSIFSMAFSVLLLTYSIQYSSSIKVVSISSSASLSNETSLSTSVWVVVIWPSPLSSSKATHFIDVNFFNFFFGPNTLFLNLLVFLSFFCLDDES